jgi:hypothetical protein
MAFELIFPEFFFLKYYRIILRSILNDKFTLSYISFTSLIVMYLLFKVTMLYKLMILPKK